MSAIIADDEQLAREELSYLLKEFPDVEILATGRNGLEAVKLIENLEPPVAEDQEPASGPPIYVGKDNDRGGDELAVVGAAPSVGNIS